MSRIETTHNGHSISYAENEDVWRCWAMDVEAKTLSAIKTKLNKLDAEARRCSVPVIVMGHYGCTIETAGLATLVDGNSVWVVSGDRHNRTERRRMTMDRTLLDTPENRAAIKIAAARRKEGEIIVKEADAMITAIPRVTADDLKSLTPKENT